MRRRFIDLQASKVRGDNKAARTARRGSAVHQPLPIVTVEEATTILRFVQRTAVNPHLIDPDPIRSLLIYKLSTCSTLDLHRKTKPARVRLGIRLGLRHGGRIEDNHSTLLRMLPLHMLGCAATDHDTQVLAIGFLLVILSAALFHNFLTLLVVATYVIAPLPNWICARCANPDDFMESAGNAVIDFGRFVTGFLVVMGIGRSTQPKGDSGD